LTEESLSGYVGLSRDILSKTGAQIGDQIRLDLRRGTSAETVEGLLMPRIQAERADDYVVVKLRTGYNVGVRIDQATKITVLGKGAPPHFTRPSQPQRTPGLPKVSIISTGGTIASRVDYRTGAVRPALTTNDLISVVPELSEIANLRTEVLFTLLSENVHAQPWTARAKTAAKYIKENNLRNIPAEPRTTAGQSAQEAKPQITSAMKQCRDCGAELPFEAVFCDLCGVSQ
jgi:glutamyl-tRNA(Gln) amidotransferase subunit D